MINQFSTVLLDMNDTFMFGADQFGSNQDYSVIYHQIGGVMEQSQVNKLIESAYSYLDIRYPDPQYREAFPSLREDVTGYTVLDFISSVSLGEAGRLELGIQNLLNEQYFPVDSQERIGIQETRRFAAPGRAISLRYAITF